MSCSEWLRHLPWCLLLTQLLSLVTHSRVCFLSELFLAHRISIVVGTLGAYVNRARYVCPANDKLECYTRMQMILRFLFSIKRRHFNCD